MTPDCSTCGLVVEYVRSCHKGGWRLFKNRPDIITRGRYYFAPKDTPHYPGMHNLWSDDWTYDRESKEEAPPLGEDRALRKGWSRGVLGVNHPPAVSLGNADCISGGEMFPQRQEQRTLIAGIDSRCWSDNGAVVPGQPPILWYQQEGLPAGADGTQVKLWKDSSAFENDARSDPFLPPPAKFTSGGFTGADFVVTTVMRIASPFTLPKDFAAFFVVQLVQGFTTAGQQALLLTNQTDGLPMLTVGRTVVTYKDSANTFTSATGAYFDGLDVWFTLRLGNLLAFGSRKKGTLFFGPVGSVVPVNVDSIGRFNVIRFAPGSRTLLEARVYPNGLTSAVFSAAFTELIAKYGL